MDSAEHVWIGDQTNLQFPAGVKSAKDVDLHLIPHADSKKTITYGQGIALGGDFYGVVGAPISTADNPQSAFRAAWASLVNSGTVMYPPYPDELTEILKVVKMESDAVEKAIREGKEPSTAYAAMGDKLSAKWAFITAMRYLSLAVENWDHFGGYAVAAYNAGHAVACREAGSAAAEKDPAMKVLRLERAYAMNAFADHFLTDLFSAGHLRVPRKEMYDRTGIKMLLGELCRTMHNEDGKNGLKVTSAAGHTWTAFGDGFLRDTKSKPNADFVARAVQDSAGEVWESYVDAAKPVKNKALLLVPDFNALIKRDDLTNYPGLFTLNGKSTTVERRTDMANRVRREWTDKWEPLKTYFELPQPGDPGYTKVACYDLRTDKFLGWLSTIRASVGSNVGIIQNEAAAHGMKWCLNGGEFFLQKDTDGGELYMGEGNAGVACWSTWVGWRRAVLLNTDGTVSLNADPKRKLYLSGGLGETFSVSWSDGDPNNNWLIRIDFPLPQPNEG